MYLWSSIFYLPSAIIAQSGFAAVHETQLDFHLVAEGAATLFYSRRGEKSTVLVAGGWQDDLGHAAAPIVAGKEIKRMEGKNKK